MSTLTVKDIKTLEDLIPLSEWVEPSIRIVREEMQFSPGHDEAHLIRVARNALELSETTMHYDVLLPAVILHDLVNVPKDSEHRSLASMWSAANAYYELNKLGISENINTRIRHAIHAHSFSANVETTTEEARILQDADRLESLGIIGLARLFTVCGELGRPMFHPTDPLAENRELDELSWGLDHFAVKLAKLYRTMKTEKGRTRALALTWDMIYAIAKMIDELEGNSSLEASRESFNRVEVFSNK